MPNVRYERIAAASVVTIDRPESRNAIDGQTARELHDAYQEFENDPGARVMVLTGAGGNFAAGADLKNLESLVPRSYLPGGPEGFTRLTSSKPTIAAVEGWAVAGGFELALWCDLRIVAESAKFAFLERRWGVPLVDGGTQRLPRIVGMGRALDLLLTGRVVASREALACGLATDIVDDCKALERALELAQQIAGVPQEALIADRQAMVEGPGLGIQEGLWLEARLGGATGEAAIRGAQRFVAGAGRGGGS